jgi:uncharacterized protein
MKYSQFNTIIPYQNQYALFNSLSQKVIFILPEIKDLLEAAMREGIDKLKIYHVSFFNYLVEQEYLVNEDIDEVEKVKEISKAVDENEKVFSLTINPTMNCNFNCWYCYETHLKQSRMSDEVVDRINRFIENKFELESLEHIDISFFGGEPLLYFRKTVCPIIDNIIKQSTKNNKSYSIGFTTNGYLINDEFIQFFAQRKITCGLQITLDGHGENHDKVLFVHKNKGSYSEIIGNIKLLILNGFSVRLRVNYTNENIDCGELIAKDLADLPRDKTNKLLVIDFHKVWQEDETDLTKSILTRNLNVVNEIGFSAVSLAMNNVLDSCYADKRNSVVLNYNGDIYKCTARDFTKENREGFINEDGDLTWMNDALERRMNSKFKNKPCLSCKILPICNGGCSQVALESQGEDYCVFNFMESEKDRVIELKIREIVGEKFKPDIAMVS